VAAAGTVATFGAPAPAVLQNAAEQSAASQRVLVVVEMAGGNDGLNTVIPYRDSAYKAARPELAIAASDVIKVEDGIGLHPSLAGFDSLLQDGQLAVIQGVGYPKPNRSHFESMDIWHTCQRKEDTRSNGWLGRFLEDRPTSSDPLAMHLGDEQQPFALLSRDVRSPSIRSLDQFRLESNDAKFRDTVRQLSAARRAPENELLSFVQSSTQAALMASERVEGIEKMSAKESGYPNERLAQKLQTVGRLIKAGLETTVYYVRIDGFDTHAQQARAHAALLRRVSESVSAFVKDMNAAGEGDRVLCLCFSEFGRRVKENASKGTDHGTAGPMFLAGASVKSGLIGKHPSLTNLQDGDLKHHTDFRQVYASLLKDWLSCKNVSSVLKGEFRPLDLVSV